MRGNLKEFVFIGGIEFNATSSTKATSHRLTELTFRGRLRDSTCRQGRNKPGVADSKSKFLRQLQRQRRRIPVQRAGFDQQERIRPV